jgi:hypothetical protein
VRWSQTQTEGETGLQQLADFAAWVCARDSAGARKGKGIATVTECATNCERHVSFLFVALTPMTVLGAPIGGHVKFYSSTVREVIPTTNRVLSDFHHVDESHAVSGKNVAH